MYDLHLVDFSLEFLLDIQLVIDNISELLGEVLQLSHDHVT